MRAKPLAVGLLALAPFLASAEDFIVGQKNKSFSVRKLDIVVGDSVLFRNDDPFFHNIFSLSEVQSFDLGTFPQGQSRKVTFEKPGVVEVECAIHPGMKLQVEVAPRRTAK